MNRPLFAVGAVAVAVTAAALVAPASAEVSKDELAKLAGTWQAVSANKGGKAVEEDELKALSIRIEGDKMYLNTPGGERPAVIKALDPAKTPATLDFAAFKDKEEGPVIHGIYKLDGDTLKFAFPKNPGDPAPKEFAPGENVGVMELKKQAAKK